MLILAGLGNPGDKYRNNRHNIGFMAADAIARRWRFGPERAKFQSVVSEGVIETPQGEVRALLMKPQTYMNESGRAVGEAARFYKVPPGEVIVFHDEIDLAPGRFRMKTGGGAAGQNGVRSLISHLGPDFRRARLGIGHPGEKHLVMPHVLGDFHKAELPWVEALLNAVADALPFAAMGDDERYQGEVLRLAPAPKFSPRQAARNDD
ncbi:aminoacyl-tRNA hydrolase [Brevundimonas sp. BAL450]|uniref:Peptidyl-tRNA hydrolase n=1 Tax=Brevundimonas abyssalis TAR-001 TaxID=1391729 RepID=A0A8E0NDF8_9CAUL|nr:MULTISPECIES: aminoacyl-tRNA hydrolase [Brevundimonas]MBG7615691.1 aminoacyl-tRNA hydrolase [Brevundimonas sp. BAL450]GAD60343.1 peptidyl-tRNA hydrolase [Brevundimonas abyssalis TAR-001]